MTQHSSLSPERWATFNLDQQILMIGNEMNRASRLIQLGDHPGLLRAYERVLRLLDLTVGVQVRYTLRRELLRWRDLIAQLYIGPEPDASEHAAVFRCLLRFTPTAALQIPLLFGDGAEAVP